MRQGFVQLDAGEIDPFDLDDLIHRYKRSAQRLWSFCGSGGSDWEHAAITIESLRELGDDELDWWEAGRPVGTIARTRRPNADRAERRRPCQRSIAPALKSSGGDEVQPARPDRSCAPQAAALTLTASWTLRCLPPSGLQLALGHRSDRAARDARHARLWRKPGKLRPPYDVGIFPHMTAKQGA